MPIIIRPLQPSDTETIDFIKKRIASHWEMTEEEVASKYILPSFTGGFPYIFIAFTKDGRFVGKIFLCREEDGFMDIHDQLWISALFVKEEFRGQGIARELIKVVEDKSRSLGFKKIYLDTVEAAGYYRKLGAWQEIGTDHWHKETVTVMVKNI